VSRPSPRTPTTLRRFAGRLALAVLVAVTALAGMGAQWMQAGATLIRVVGTSSAESRWAPDQPMYILVLGDDARAGAGCGCADAIHVVAVPAGGGGATILNIPRDTRVQIPGRGMGKINATLPQGGPQLAADTVAQLVGVPIAYTLVIGFDAWPALVDELGGITVDVPERMYDRRAGADLQAGPVKMDGRAAQAFSRARYIPGGDFARTEHQGLLLISALAEAQLQGGGTPQLLRNLAVFSRHTRLENMTTSELVRLGQLAMSLDHQQVRNVTMPGGTATIGGVSYVTVGAAAPGLFADLADDGILQAH
jgi:polyisoprenyl-teichoic acid--peptidoglycan teichoic acid transferase